MKITGYRSLTTVHHWHRAVGDVNGHIDQAVTEVPVLLLETDEGITGIGLGAHRDIDRVFPALDGADPRAVGALYDRMIAHVFKAGHQGATFGAIGAADMALWDLKAKAAGEPLWRTLGAADRFVPGYASGLDAGLDDEQLVAVYAEFAERGFTAAKIKGGLDLARDRTRLALVRDVLARRGARPALMIDVNEAWNQKQAVRHVRALEADFDLAWVEEPVRRWDADGLRLVRESVRAAVASGENLTGLEQFRPLLQARAVDVLQTGSVWGITHFLRVATLAHAFDLPVSPVGYHTDPLAAAAAAIPNHFGLEVQNLDQPVGITSAHTVQDGGVVLGDVPGSGLAVDEAAVALARSGEGPPGRAAAGTAWTLATGPHVRPARAGLRLCVD